MPNSAKTYLALTCIAGVATMASVLPQWRSDHILQFLLYLACAVLASGLKVTLPGIAGTLSVNFIFILVAVTELSLAQTLVIGCAATLAQCFWHARNRPQPVQLAFNVCNAALCTAACYLVFHSATVQRLEDSLPILLFWSAASYFLMNTFLVSGIITLTERKNIWSIWHQNFFWTAPQYLFGAGLAGLIHKLNEYFGWQHAILMWPGIYLLYRSYRLYLRRLEAEQKHVTEMADLHLRTIEALALAIDAKDETTHDHLRRVQVYGMEIAKELGLPEEEIQALKAATLLHDIGKLAVPEYILSKPGRLTPEEFERMKIHPTVGAEILECVNFPYPVVPIVRSHHEKWDGSGYPLGLKGEEIPIGARILSAVDCLDALASDRPYRRALPIEEALQHVVGEAGKSFDPRVVEVLERRFNELNEQAEGTAISLLKLSRKSISERGVPAAGFDTLTPAPDSRLEEGMMDFISSIASARHEFQMLHEMTRDLGSSLSIDETLSLLAERLKGMVPHHTAVIYLLKDGKLTPQYVRGEDARLFSSLTIPFGHGLSGWVAENKTPVVNGNPSVEAGYLGDPTKFSILRSAISVPLEGLAGVVGALTLYHADQNAFTRDHLRILLAVSSKVGLTIENALQFHLAQKSAFTDPLTGLPNTRPLFLHLNNELARYKRSERPIAVLVLDLDGFKQVNDRFGHLHGNRVLQMVAQGLKESCRSYDYAARLGGDEFVVIVPEITRHALERKIEEFGDMVRSVGRRVCGEEILSVSVGAALFPDDGIDAEQLLAAADKRMYQMKQSHHIAQKPIVPVTTSSDEPAVAIQ